jgi:hypothetical protein
MKVTPIAAGIMILAASAMADPWALTGKPTACAALESLVVFGLVDGGIGGDTNDFTAVVSTGDRQRCLAWLDSYGFGDGIRLQACRDTFDTLNAEGLPENSSLSDAEAIREILSAQNDDDCTGLASELKAKS